MMPALLMSASKVSTLELMVAAAARIDSKEERSRGIKIALVEAQRDLISEITGVILDSLRPRRKIALGLPAAREMAVRAPTPPLLGPVMITDRC
jgi:hypothetical protein